MNASPHREIACAIIIDTSGSFLLQQRDDVVGILHPGKVSLFGGHREGSETFLECVVREIHEEPATSYKRISFNIWLDSPEETSTLTTALSTPNFSLLATFRSSDWL
jgi:hypothetical protein